MNRTKINFRMGFVLAMILSAAAGCNRQKSATETAGNTPPDKIFKDKMTRAGKTLPPTKSMDVVAQQMRQPPIPPQNNSAQEVQRTLQTVEEINRMNRLNQQLRQTQTQNQKH